MRINQGVEWGAHCATLLAALPPGEALPAAKLAEYHGVPGPYLAKTLQALARAKIVESIPGRRGGYRLAKPSTEITLLDILIAVDGGDEAFHCTEIRCRGPARAPRRLYAAHCGIARAMWDAEQIYRESLRRTTIAELVAHVMQDAPRESLVKAGRWLEAALSRGG